MARTTVQTAQELLRARLDDIAPVSGDRLPPERVLSDLLDCSRDTLRKCLTQLELEGEIWRHVGQGTFRGNRPRFKPVPEAVLTEGASPLDLMRARRLLEPQVAAEAARQADRDDILYLRDKVSQGRKATDRSDCELADDAFHSAVAHVSKNQVLIGLLSLLSATRRRIAWQREWNRVYREIGTDEFRTVHSDQHTRIVDGIAAGDPDRAIREMDRHLGTIETAMSSNSGPFRDG